MIRAQRRCAAEDVVACIVVLIAITACGDPAPAIPQHSGLDGLRAHLVAARRSPERAADGWLVAERDWPALVTGSYAAHWPMYRDELARRRVELIAALRAAPDQMPRVQYADDPSLTPEQVRLRWVLPSGRPGAVADGIPAVFIYDTGGWRALVSLDAPVLGAAERIAPGCGAAYLATAPKTCQEWAWAIAEAALGAPAGDRDARLARACGNAMAQGCGR